MRPVDYPYAKDLLTRINALTYFDRPISEFFQYGGMDFWQTYQTFMFIRLKRFTQTKRVPQPLSMSLRIKAHAARLLALMFSGLSILVFAIRRPDFIIYTVDGKPQGTSRCDFRLQDLYHALSESHAGFGEVIHSTLTHDAFRNAWKRRRFALYLPAIEYLSRGLSFVTAPPIDASMVDLSSFESEEAEFVRFLLTAVADDFRLLPRRLSILSTILSWCRPRAVFLIDDGYHYFELIASARRATVPTIAIQHGHFTRYQVGVLPYGASSMQPVVPDTLLVWSDYWKQVLSKLHSVIPDSQVVVAGSKHASGNEFVPLAKRNSHLTVLIPYETDAPKDQLRPLVEVLRQEGVEILFKPRSDIPLQMQCAEYGVTSAEVENDASFALSRAHAVIGCYSTFLYDAVLMGRPVLQLSALMDYGSGMVENGIANALSIEKEALLSGVKSASAFPEEELRRRRSLVYGKQTSTLERTLKERITEYLHA